MKHKHTHTQDLFELFGFALPVSGIGGLCFNLAGAAIFGDPSGEPFHPFGMPPIGS